MHRKKKMQNELKNGKMLQFLQKMALKLQNSYIVSSYNKLAISAMIPKWQKSWIVQNEKNMHNELKNGIKL